MLRIIFGIFLLVVFVFNPSGVIASGEFSTSYEISYSVLGDGVTSVTEDIKLKNLTDKFFPSSFSLIVPGEEITDVEAGDSQGKLEVQTSGDEKGTKIIVKFINQQIIGLNKEYSFRLNFRDQGIAKSLGKVWSIKIPRISQQTKVEDFSLVLSVPTSFGDPDYIFPVPSTVNESGGRINMKFIGNQFFQSGISAIFGQNLNYSFKSFYSLSNNSIFPKYKGIPVGLDSGYQKTYLENIYPRPENSEIDELGNTVAFFKLNPGQNLEVEVSGSISTFLNYLNKPVLGNEFKYQYLEENKYWAPNNPVIKAKLEEILGEGENKSSLEKAGLIDKFVSNFLNFDYSRIEKGDFLRFGALTALNNPEKALSAEFSDLEIALFRSAEIPSRQVIGFSLPQGNRPFSYQNKSLHSWVEFYDQDLGWLTADPAWQNTTGGTALFNFNDLNHLGLAYSNGNPNFTLPYKVEAKLFEGEVLEKKVSELDIKISPEILSGFPSKAKIRINNLGNTSFPASELKLNTAKILLESPNNEPLIAALVKTPQIPPFGYIEYDYNLKTGAIWHSYQDILQVEFAGVTDSRIITVKPILSYKIFAIEIFGAFIMISLFYIVVFLIHKKSAKKTS